MFGDAVRDLLDPRLRGGGGRLGADAARCRLSAPERKSQAGFYTDYASTDDASVVQTRLRCELIDERAIRRNWYWLAFRFSGFDPRFSGYLYFPKRVLRRVAECRACFQVRDISDVTLVLVAVEDVYAIVLHRSLMARWSGNRVILGPTTLLAHMIARVRSSTNTEQKRTRSLCILVWRAPESRATGAAPVSDQTSPLTWTSATSTSSLAAAVASAVRGFSGATRWTNQISPTTLSPCRHAARTASTLTLPGFVTASS